MNSWTKNFITLLLLIFGLGLNACSIDASKQPEESETVDGDLIQVTGITLLNHLRHYEILC